MAVEGQRADAGDVSVADRRNAKLYLAGLGASVIGSSAMSLVAGIWVKSLTGSSAQAGLVSACIYAPSLAGPIAGMVADRVRRRRWLVVLNVASAAAVLPLLAVRSRATDWIVFCVMAWYGFDLVLQSPAENALFVEMPPLELRRRVNGWVLGLQETGRLVAPLLGAGLFAVAGGGSVAVLDSATFLVAAVAISRLGVSDDRSARTDGNLLVGLLAGLQFGRRTEALRRVVGVTAAVMALSGLLVASQYSLVQAIGEPPSFLGVPAAALGAGSIVASLVSPRLISRIGEAWLAVLGAADFAAGNLLRATGWLPAAVVGSVILGFALPWMLLAAVNLAQPTTPVRLQGRVSAAVTLALFGPQAPLQAPGSLAIASVTYRDLYIGTAIAAAACAAWFGSFTVRRRRSGSDAGPGARPPMAI
ncbi:MAG: MFS transporter [Trebonia sp.]